VPSLTIAGNGGVNTAANTITFNFSKAVKDGLFTVDDGSMSITIIRNIRQSVCCIVYFSRNGNIRMFST
jgi:hypothetical protein